MTSCKRRAGQFIQFSRASPPGNQTLTISSTPTGAPGSSIPATSGTPPEFIPTMASTLIHLGSSLSRTATGIRINRAATVEVGAVTLAEWESDGNDISMSFQFFGDDGSIEELASLNPVSNGFPDPIPKSSVVISTPGLFRVVYSSSAPKDMIIASATISASIQQS